MLTSNGKPDIEITIQKGSTCNRKTLLDLKNNEKLGDNVDVIYIYSLKGEEVEYPQEGCKIIYIGEAGRKEKTGTRFSQHISTDENTGNDTGTNYTLSHYYWSGKKLYLQIFILDTKNNSSYRKSIESQLLKAHLKKYGSLPIAQGASGKNYTVSSIKGLVVPKVLLKIIDK